MLTRHQVYRTFNYSQVKVGIQNNEAGTTSMYDALKVAISLELFTMIVLRTKLEYPLTHSGTVSSVHSNHDGISL